MAVEGEQTRQRVPVSGVARVSHVHRPGGVGRYEFDEDALGRDGPTAAKLLARAERLRERPE